MADTAALARARSLACHLLADWLAERTGVAVSLAPQGDALDPAVSLARGAVGAEPVAVGLICIAPPIGAGGWYEAKADLEDRLAGHLPPGCVIWAPQGAELPAREPDRSAFILAAEELLGRCVPGGHGEIRLPVTLVLRKSDAEGAYLTARGGLAPAWARFTNRVFGHYQLDSSELHRLPAGEGYLDELIEAIVALANRMELGERREIAAEDAWVAQRLRGGEGVLIVGEPPASELASGAALRRGLRRSLGTAREALAAEQAAARLIVIVGPYTSIADQPVGAALLGFDPAMTRGLDLIALAAEGRVQPLLDLTRRPLLAAREG